MDYCQRCPKIATQPSQKPIYCDIHVNCQRPIGLIPVLPQPLLKIPKIVRVYKITEFILVPAAVAAATAAEGTYGEIIAATIKATGIPVILKKYKEKLTNVPYFTDKIKEILLLQHLNQYPDTKVVKFYGICIDQDDLYLVLERLEKTLHDVTKNQCLLPPGQYKIILHQIVRAIYAFHSLGVIHNDIKLANLMLSGNEIKIIDLGLAQFLGVGPTQELVNTYRTTQTIKAPDDSFQVGYVLTNRKSYASDVYSIGACFIHMIACNYPFLRVSMVNRTIKDVTGEDYLPYLNRVLTPIGVDLLFNMMNPDTHQRWCCRQALNHPYFSDVLTTGIDRTLVGGGGHNWITDYRFKTALVSYTPEEYINQSMELCYFREIHVNYMNDRIPIDNVSKKINFVQTMEWLLRIWNDKADVLSVYDSVINTLLMSRKMIDNCVDRGGTRLFNGVTLMLNSLYDNIVRTRIPNYISYTKVLDQQLSTEDLRKIMIDELMIGLNIQYDFIPVWCHIMYVYLEFTYTVQDPRAVLFRQQYDLLVELTKWVLFYFIQPTPFTRPITTWELVKFCVLHFMVQGMGTPLEDLLGRPVVDWLTLPPDLYGQLHRYYAGSLVVIRDHVIPTFEKHSSKPLTELYFT
jgi:serine/threonine protein kinase